ncbi:MAG: cytochrome-c peroxidase [Rhodocyclaceae bacterium]
MNRHVPHLSIATLLSVFAATLVVLTWREAPPVAVESTQTRAISEALARSEPVTPIPLALPDEDPERIRLGRMLFHERMLSRDDSIACSTCHRRELGGADGLARSPGVEGALGVVNTPSVFNVRFGVAQFWDGRAKTLEDQAGGPIHNPLEMDSNWEQVITKLARREDYREQFRLAYPREGMSAVTIAAALAAYERSLVTPNAPFDRYLRGDIAALTADEAEGYARFKRLGCASCHQGVNIGGNLYQRFGVMGDYFADRGAPTRADLGRYNVTGDEADRHVFKVPSLRNVALTAPYFHDAGADTLEEAVDIMGRYQLGRPLTAEDRRLIVAFLRSLTGELPQEGRE